MGFLDILDSLNFKCNLHVELMDAPNDKDSLDISLMNFSDNKYIDQIYSVRRRFHNSHVDYSCMHGNILNNCAA